MSVHPEAQSTIDVRRFFEVDPGRYAVHLKLLDLYRDVLLLKHWEVDGETCIVLSYPVGAVPSDREAYPTADLVVMPVITSHAFAPHLLSLLRVIFSTQQTVVFKFCDTLTSIAVSHMLPIQYQRSFIAYTTPPNWEPHDTLNVEQANRLNLAPIGLLGECGYTFDDLKRLFNRGAVAFYRQMGGQYIAVCMAYPYDSNIWEVGLLHTVESERRMGHGRAVAGAALEWILATGRTPRLQAGGGDAPLRGLAGSLNMVEVVHFAHYLKPSEPEL